MIKLLLAAILALLLAACHNESEPQKVAASQDPLAGTYTVNMQGTIIRLKVETNNGHYTMAQYDNRNGSWMPLKRDFTPVSQAAFEKKTGSTLDGYVAGMESGDMLMLHVPAGWSRGQASTKTGYLLLWGNAYEMQKDS